MLQFELTHKCARLQQLFLFSTWTVCSGGVIYANFRVSDVTNPGGTSCSSYQPFVVVLKKTISLKANISLCFEL